MTDSERPDHDSDRRSHPERVIDVSGHEPVVVEEDPAYPTFAGGTERIRVFVASGGRKTCVIPILAILLLLCCSCIVFWSLTDNLF